MGSSNNADRFGPTGDHVDKLPPDIFVRCEGAIFLFEPLSVAGQQWIDENVQSDAQWYGNALVVEWRYAGELAAGMREAGLILG
jgi:hypothetical protein